MSSRPSPPTAPPPAESDPDGTAELPVLDPADVMPGDEPPHGTDTWILTPRADAAPAADEQRLQAKLETAAAKLREAQELLASKVERLGQVERARDEEHSAHAATQARITVLNAELAASQAALTQQAVQLAEAQRALSDAEQRAAATAAELTLARELVSSSRAESTRELAQLELRDAHNRAAGERFVEDLEFERTRCLTYLEVLQTVEAQRQITASLTTELEQELAQRAQELENLTRELAKRDDRVRELETELSERGAHQQRVEQQVSSFSALLEQRDRQLGEARQEAQGLRASVTRLQEELSAAGERLRAQEAAAEREQQSRAQQQGEIERLRSERADLDIALAAARTAAADAAAQVAAHESSFAGQRARVAELEATLAAERERATGLDNELSTTRGEMEEWSGVLRTLQQQRNAQLDGASASETRTRELEREVAGQRTAIAALKTDNEARAARARELEADLYAAEAAVHRLEREVRSRGAHGAAPARSAQPQRTPTEPRPMPADVPAVAAPAVSIRPAAEPVADGTSRLLIRSDDGREVVHVLARKTSIGRTADNDLQIDAKFISRHHAVILAGPAQTIIEDLNSTNGVLVNGRRVTRQILNDGDQVTIGRALYRFAVRRGGDKR